MSDVKKADSSRSKSVPVGSLSTSKQVIFISRIVFQQTLSNVDNHLAHSHLQGVFAVNQMEPFLFDVFFVDKMCWFVTLTP